MTLKNYGDSLLCEVCKKSYPIKDGIASFIDSTDKFYEGKFVTMQYDPTERRSFLIRIFASFLTLLSQSHLRYRFFKIMMVGANNKVLDIGCGGGE